MHQHRSLLAMTLCVSASVFFGTICKINSHCYLGIYEWCTCIYIAPVECYCILIYGTLIYLPCVCVCLCFIFGVERHVPPPPPPLSSPTHVLSVCILFALLQTQCWHTCNNNNLLCSLCERLVSIWFQSYCVLLIVLSVNFRCVKRFVKKKCENDKNKCTIHCIYSRCRKLSNLRSNNIQFFGMIVIAILIRMINLLFCFWFSSGWFFLIPSNQTTKTKVRIKKGLSGLAYKRFAGNWLFV